jgi:hypothetical protein
MMMYKPQGLLLLSGKKNCRPKQQEGLRVINLDIQNRALLLKNVHKLFNSVGTPWVNLVSNSYYANGVVPRQGSFW